MRNVLTASSSGSSERPTTNEVDLNDEILTTLPSYLQMEVAIYARAELIRRHDKFFFHCSNGFLVALSSSLSRQRTLLTGDYLMKRGEEYLREFILIASGTLHVRLDKHTIKTLGRGDIIGRGWLLQLKNESTDPALYSADTDWLASDGKGAVSIRATSPCVLLTGLSSPRDIQKLERGYKVDFKLLRAEVRAELMDETERRAIAMKGIAKAVRRFKKRKQIKRLSMLRMSSGVVDTEALRRLVEEDAEMYKDENDQ